jgi:hypothetical protein
MDQFSTSELAILLGEKDTLQVLNFGGRLEM